MPRDCLIPSKMVMGTIPEISERKFLVEKFEFYNHEIRRNRVLPQPWKKIGELEDPKLEHWIYLPFCRVFLVVIFVPY